MVIAVVMTMAMVFTGCVYNESSMTLNDNGSGKVSVVFGYSKEMADSLEKEVLKEMYPKDAKDYRVVEKNGVKYNVATCEYTFKSLEDLNKMTGGTSLDGMYSFLKFEKNAQGYKLRIDQGTKETAASSSESDKKLEEAIKSGLYVVFKIEMPVAITDVKSDKPLGNAVSYSGRTLVCDFVKLEESDSTYIDIYANTSAKAKDVEEQKFSDVNENAWYAKAVEDISRKGVVKGYPNREFMPKNNVKYAELCKIMASLTGKTDITSQSGTYWGEGYILYFDGKDRAGKLAADYDSIKARGEAYVSREEAFYMLDYAYSSIKGNANTDLNKEFSDSGMINGRFKGSIESLYGKSLIKGSDGKINPKGNLTRAELCVMIHRMEQAK